MTNSGRDYPAMAEVDPPRVRVMLVEDNADVRRAVAALVNDSGDLEVCAEVASVAEAREAAASSHPDVAIIDLRLPDGTGVEAGKNLRLGAPDVRLLLLTSASEPEARSAAIRAGASGFLLKQLVGNDLIAALRSIASGETLIDLSDRIDTGPSPVCTIEDSMPSPPLGLRPRPVV